MVAIPDTNLTRAQARHRSETLQVHGYKIELDLTDAADPAVSTFATVSTIDLTSSEPNVLLDFIGESVDLVTIDAEPRPFAYDGARVEVGGIPAGRRVRIRVEARARYSHMGQGLHRYVDPADGLTYLYSHSEPSDARRFIACLDQPDLKAPFQVSVTAPSSWLALSNQPVTSSTRSGGATRHEFAATPPLSTYLLCVAAGPYRRWEDVWSDGAATVPLGVLCRQSIAEAMDAQTVLDLTKAGLTFCHALFAYPYPWGKYDSIFVPEYNLGAMENPGLVTFNDDYVFQSAATRHQYEARATTILHEMAHMWFGDLVTPPWWSDLWLKESFADYLGTLAAVEASEFTQAWTSFALARKSRGSADDQRPTTHPIVADIPDVEAASQNFDGITYSKGAAVLKQLAAYVGSDAFTRATRAYFRTHAFGCATLEDLLQALQEASGRHLQSWAHEWLATAGISTITAQVDASADTIERFTVTQSGVDAVTGEPVVRPHRLAVGFYQHEDDQGGIESLTRTHRFEVDLVDDSVDVPEAVGLPLPDLLLLNDDDLTYAIVRLDETSTRTALDRLGAIPEALSRAVAWGALWDACRDGLLSGHDYVDAALHQAGREPHPGLQSVALHRVPLAVESFLAGQDRMAARRRVLDAAWEHLLTAPPGSDAQLTWARIFALAASVDDARAQDLRDVLTGRRVVDGLVLSTQLTWSWWTALSATGHAAEPELRRLRELDSTSLAPIRLEQALAARPDAAVKEAVWTALLGETTASNDLVTARVTGWAQAGQEHVRPGRLAAYLAALEPVWHGRGQEIAERILQVAFPSEVDLSDAADGDPINHPVVLGATAWLGAHPDAPRALRSIVIEGSDDVVRALRAQAFTEVTRPRVVSAPSP